MRTLIVLALAIGVGCSKPSSGEQGDAALSDASGDSSTMITLTESTWLGTNVSGDLPWSDITY